MSKKRTSYLKQGRNSKGRFTKKKVKYTIWNKIKKFFKFFVMIIAFGGCASKYQVVQELNVNMYHMHNPRTHEVEIILTEEQLKVGGYYKLKDINIISVDKADRK